MSSSRGIAFVGTYVPQHCGIATFTDDLSTAVSQQVGKNQAVSVVAMKDRPEGYDYSDRVKFEIRRDFSIDYARAADFLNLSRVGVVSLQHEFGIFGGEYGSNLLTLLRDLRRPLVVTCHTVLQNPNTMQKEVFDEVIARANRIVVMTQKAFQILESVYGVGSEKAVLIPHGIHDVSFVDPAYYKDHFGVEGRRVLLTFGLLSRNKGVEQVIDALPAIVAKHPKTTYLVLGATHPAVVREEGESYRLELQRRVREHGLEENVIFHPRYVELEELLEYIGAADIFVAPYHNLDQITSGAMSYAMGAGKAVVATPFWHAEELLAEGRGRIVPVGDPQAIAREINSLFDNEVELSAMRKRAYTYCRHMVWSSVARSYLGLFDMVSHQTPTTLARASALRSPISPTNVPAPKIDQLARMTDDTGPAHHASYTVPVWSYGYRLEDAAAALVASTKYQRIHNDDVSARLRQTYLALIITLIGEGKPAAGMTYTREREGLASDVAIGKALWALGYVIRDESSRLADPALDTFHLALTQYEYRTPRGAGYAILGAANYLARFEGASDVRRFLVKHVAQLRKYCESPDWLEQWQDHDWALPVQALGVACDSLGDDKLRAFVAALAETLVARTNGGTVFRHPARPADTDEIPVSAAIFIEAMNAVHHHTKNAAALKPVRAAADWFLGANRLGVSLYDFSTGGCYDALMASGLNRNQGTEATVFCLLAFLTLQELARVAPALHEV